MFFKVNSIAILLVVCFGMFPFAGAEQRMARMEQKETGLGLIVATPEEGFQL
jgi:hypothetical protein